MANALLVKPYGSHGKYKPELNEYFYMYRYQLYIAIFCVTSAPGISWQQLYLANLLVRSAYRFYVYFHVRIILHHLGNSLPNEMVLARSKILILKRRITVFVTAVVLIQMKHGQMEISFIQQNMTF